MDEIPNGKSLVVLVEDDRASALTVQSWLEEAGYQVEVFPDGESCLGAFSRLIPAAVLLDLFLPGLNGLEVLGGIRAKSRNLPVIMMTIDASVANVVTAMQLGAFDYLVKPLQNTKLLATVRNAVERSEMSLRIAELEREAGRSGHPRLIGQSPAMKSLMRQLDRLGTSDISVLVQGETGSGKELVARTIHEQSARQKGPFIALNCAAIPETLQETELFGHEKGAFTGAVQRKPGKFELATGGTLFLDEVSELSLPLQAKLLRALQERRFHRLGGTVEIKTDFRLLSASNRKLAGEVRAGRFREDLFFRIAVYELQVPPLRERLEDIPLLAWKFLGEFLSGPGKKRVEITPEAMQLLKAYRWPGNVRELQNVIQGALVACNGLAIAPADLPAHIQRRKGRSWAPGGFPRGVDREPAALRGAGDLPVMTLAEAEKVFIAAALRRTGGNLAEVTRQLGIGRTTLYRKMKEFGLDRPEEKKPGPKSGKVPTGGDVGGGR